MPLQVRGDVQVHTSVEGFMLLLGGQPHTPNAVLQISLVWVAELTAPVGTGHSQYFVAVFQVVP